MIYRSKHDKSFTLIDNEIINDERLSSGAFRLLAFMLSCSDLWKFSLKGLAQCLGLSERTISDRLTELRLAGYIEQRRITNERGQIIGCEWDVYEVPKTTPQKNHDEVKPQRGKTTTWKTHGAEKPQRGFPATITNNNSNKTKYNKTKSNKYEGKEPAKKCRLGPFENVLLTNEEQKDLTDRLGFDEVVLYIDRLSNYLHEHPEKKYKSHKATIERWIRQDEGSA